MTGVVVSAGYLRLRTRIVAHRLTDQTIAAIKLLHTAVVMVDATCGLYVTYSGIRDRATLWTAVSLGAVADGDLARRGRRTRGQSPR